LCASTRKGPNYTQSIKLSATGQTVAGQPPSGTVTVPTIQEMVTVNNRVGLSATTLSSSYPNAPVGTLITLTATVQAAASGNPTPTGKVTGRKGTVKNSNVKNVVVSCAGP